MSADDDYKKKSALLNQGDETTEGDSGETGESGQGGKSGQIEFRDFTASTQHIRDDLLPDEKRRLLSVHDNLVEVHVKKQKDKKSEYKALKDRKITLAAHRQGLAGSGISAQHKGHPILSNKAQFSGIDRQVSALPNENVADTNEANRNELENQYRLRYAPGMQPTFNPKPSINR